MSVSNETDPPGEIGRPKDTESPVPHELWGKAYDVYPDDHEARQALYRDLMVAAGHIVPRAPGEPMNLPCGWPHRTERTDG